VRNDFHLELRHLTKKFGETAAVDDISFDIPRGSFATLLGPSGCGKTTTLRMIAGFYDPDKGDIILGGRRINELPAHRRGTAMVFQDYALFPHMTVGENVAYGLMIRKVPKAERAARANEMLDMVALGGLGGRRPSQLSGGQRQRVALARALINQPSVLLLDEPLGALDLKLREQMQVELKAIQRQVGITFIYVTHDQGEALSMSDRIAVFNKGRIEQIASPTEVYEHPATAFVAGFVGVSNLLDGAAAAAITGIAQPFSIRPEKIVMVQPGSGVGADCLAADGTIDSVLYLGSSTRYNVALAKGGDLTVIDQNRESPAADGWRHQGNPVRLVWQRDHIQHIGSAAGGR